MLSDHWNLSSFMCVNYLKRTLCTIIAHDPLKFVEQVHGEEAAVGSCLKIITIFQNFSYLFDGILAGLDRAMDWQTGNYLLVPALLLCSATSHESPHSPVSIIPPSFISFVCVGFKMLKEVNIFLLDCRLLEALFQFL